MVVEKLFGSLKNAAIKQNSVLTEPELKGPI